MKFANSEFGGPTRKMLNSSALSCRMVQKSRLWRLPIYQEGQRSSVVNVGWIMSIPTSTKGRGLWQRIGPFLNFTNEWEISGRSVPSCYLEAECVPMLHSKEYNGMLNSVVYIHFRFLWNGKRSQRWCLLSDNYSNICWTDGRFSLGDDFDAICSGKSDESKKTAKEIDSALKSIHDEGSETLTDKN